MSIVEEDLAVRLPGQPKVGFKQYAGYVDVDVKSGKSLFYYFVEAEVNPNHKPLTLWLNGGPGCSSIGGGAFTELGPFYPTGDGRGLRRNSKSWNKASNLLVLISSLYDVLRDGAGRGNWGTPTDNIASKLINVAVPNTIDERAINTKIQLLSSLDLKKTPQLLELVEEEKDMDELMNLSPEKVLLKWMNFQLKKSGYEKEVTNFSTDLKDGAAYAHLLNALAPELQSNTALETEDPTERANLILQQAEKMDCKRYVTPKDIVEGSTNLNIAFVAEIFQHRLAYFDNLSWSLILLAYIVFYIGLLFFIIFAETCKMLPTNKSCHVDLILCWLYPYVAFFNFD